MSVGSLVDTCGLTNRERETLALLARGMRNREIARSLCLSEATVENYLHRIFRKLAVRNRVEAAIAAVRAGLIEVAGDGRAIGEECGTRAGILLARRREGRL